MIFKRKAVTLIEVIIVVGLASMIIVAVMNLFSSGMKGSAKGLAHQTNMESASIIMAQIEYDLLRATTILQPEASATSNSDKAVWKFNSEVLEPGKTSTVTYSKANEGFGICREVKMNGGKELKTIFGKLQKVNLSFRRFIFNTGSKRYPVYKDGMLVEVTVSSVDNKRGGSSEAFTLRRLIVVRAPIR